MQSGFLMSKRTESCKQPSAFTHAPFRTCVCCQGSWLSVAWHQCYSPELMEISVESLCEVLFFGVFFFHRAFKLIIFLIPWSTEFRCVMNQPLQNTLNVWVTQTLAPDSSLCINGADLRYERKVCQIKYGIMWIR